jgi:hypothetical protein
MNCAANSMGTLPLTGRAGVGCAPGWISGRFSPFPNPHRKGEGDAPSFGLDQAKPTVPHLPLDGGGWEGVRPTLGAPSEFRSVSGAN